uniref:Epithelial stromal interaction 1 n=1 Tax=Astatotilapia calliptera TaxID=8154 RepID=A0AAX7USW4_ASTCA
MTDVSGQDQTLPNPNVHGNPQVPTGQPRYSDGYTIIPPNESKRNEMKTIAQKEEEALNRWKETQRVPSVCVNPERLGGDVTLAEVRQKQQINHQSMKLQKKIKKAEDDKRKRQEEEEKLQKMKAKQREKAEHLREKERQEDQRRREEFEPDRLRTQERFLQNFERKASSASTTAIRTSSRASALSDRRHRLRDESLRPQSSKRQTSSCGSDQDPGSCCSFSIGSISHIALPFISSICRRVLVCLSGRFDTKL